MNGKLSLIKQIGIVRSFFIYYLKPFNGKRLINFYGLFVKKGDLCFDIGAHLGNRSNAWLKMGAKVVAVEPQPTCIRFLNKKFSYHENFQLVTMAVGERKGKAAFRISSLYPTISTISKTWQFSKKKKPEQLTYWDDQIEVEITTLDDLISEYGIPHFCKIDVEDFELEVINGLSHPIPSLSFEFFPAKIEKAVLCLNKLAAIGNYKYNISYKEYLKLVNNEWLTLAEIIRVLENHYKDISGDIYARLVKD